MIAASLGYSEYRFYEKKQPGIIADTLTRKPFIDLKAHGFKVLDKERMEGIVNGYTVIINPTVNSGGFKVLIIMILIELQEGLDQYFVRYNEHFRFFLTGPFIVAEAILKDYEQTFNYEKLFSLINATTLSLKENNIKALSVTDE